MIRLDDAAGEDRSGRFEPVSEDLQSELIEAAERGQVRASEGDVRHVEVVLDG